MADESERAPQLPQWAQIILAVALLVAGTGGGFGAAHATMREPAPDGEIHAQLRECRSGVQELHVVNASITAQLAALTAVVDRLDKHVEKLDGRFDSSPIVRVMGFSHQTALPRRAAMAAMTPCQ